LTAGTFIRGASLRLSESGSESPWLDAMLLLAMALGTNKERMLAALPDELTNEQVQTATEYIDRRMSGEILAYIQGTKEFHGRNFLVGPGVLVPRPETEHLVDWVLECFSANKSLRLHDTCTGTGCIPLTLSLEKPDWIISASDISEEALVWARKNAALLGVGAVAFSKADLLANVKTESFDAITANPPYVNTHDTLQLLESGWKEPSLALDGGDDGLSIIRRIASQARSALHKGGGLYLEIGDGQAQDVHDILLEENFVDISLRKDLAGIPRVCHGIRP